MKNVDYPEVSKITLKSVYSKDRKLIMQPTKDTRSGWYKGVKRLSEDEKKKETFWIEPTSRLTIIHNMEFNLLDEVDLLNWEWIKHSNAIAMSFEDCQQSKEALFYVDNEEIESRKSVDADELIFKAMEYIFKDRLDMLADRARILGHALEGSSPSVIREVLLKMAKNPQKVRKVIGAYENDSTAIHLLFLKASDKSIIRMENGAFLYGTTVLGVTEDAVLKTMQDPINRELVLEIEKDLNGSKKPKAQPAKVKVPTPVVEPEPIVEPEPAPEPEPEPEIEAPEPEKEEVVEEPVAEKAPKAKAKAKTSNKPIVKAAGQVDPKDKIPGMK